MTKGAYQLLIRLDRDQTITVGRIGRFRFPAGYYVYTGSAMNGIEARVRRHLSSRKRIRWHIDYLLEHARIIRYAIRESPVSDFRLSTLDFRLEHHPDRRQPI